MSNDSTEKTSYCGPSTKAEIRAARIKQALLHVHLLERCSSRPQGLRRADAYKAAITGSGMTSDECAVLRRALHIADAEVTES